MAVAPRLDLRQTQSLVMTPQLQQAIRLLALSNLEIEAYVAEEIEKNPLLEVAKEDGPARHADNGGGPEDDDRMQPSGESSSLDMMNDGGDGASSDLLDADYTQEKFHHDCVSDMPVQSPASAPVTDMIAGPGLGGDWGEDGPDFDSFAAPEDSLAEHIEAQLGMTLSGRALFIARALVDMIEPTGYLMIDLSETARHLGIAREEVVRAVEAIQACDPVGVGARDLAECLALQAREADRYDPAMATLIGNLDLLARGDFKKLKRLCRVDDEDLRDMIAELRAYDPKPGLAFDRSAATAVIPDIYVTRKGEGWSIELNGASLPRVLINRAYHAELSAASVGSKTSKSWLGECLASANWLVKALDQRQRTIVRVATEIVRRQEDFFQHGVSRLKPLTLREVAEAIEMHESTVSRVTSNKYLYCDRGLFELKYFFSSGIQSSDGNGSISAEAVKAALKKLIEDENPAKILSDAKLVDLLNAQGFDLARRTVVKYREAMGIGSSVQRRRQKALAG